MQILLNLSLISVLFIGCQQIVESNTNQNFSDILKNSPRIEGNKNIYNHRSRLQETGFIWLAIKMERFRTWVGTLKVKWEAFGIIRLN